MFILIFLPVYVSIFFVVVFKILVNSVTDMGDSPSYLKFNIYNPPKGSPLVPVDTNAVYLVYGNEVMELPDVQPGKINVKLMTY